MMQSTWPFLTTSPTSTNGAGARLRRAVERADDRRLHDRQLHLPVIGGSRLRGSGGSGRGRRLRGDRRRDGRGRHGGRDDDGVTAVLPDADLEALVLELELGEIVLPHHGENQFDFVEIHRLGWPTAGRPSVQDERSRNVGQHLDAGHRDEHVILDAHAAPAGHVGPRFDREHHARHEMVRQSSRAGHRHASGVGPGQDQPAAPRALRAPGRGPSHA